MTLEARSCEPMSVERACDYLFGGRLRLHQLAHGHRVGFDAVMLAAAVPLAVDKPETLIEAGAGVGAASLACALRAPKLSATGVEIEPRLAALMAENVSLNGFADRVGVITADVTGALSQPPLSALPREQFDHVIANPPYWDPGAVRASSDPLKARAHVLGDGGLDGWLRFLASMARPGGRLTLIHRGDALDQVIEVCARRFGGLTLLPLHPKPGEAAHRIIVRGEKGHRGRPTIRPGIVVHGADGQFTDAIQRVLADGVALDF